MDSLGKALTKEQARARELLIEYSKIGPAGKFGAAMIKKALQRADRAVMNGDIAKMMESYNELYSIK